MAGLEQALRHGRAHAADADPADLLCSSSPSRNSPLKSCRDSRSSCRALAVLRAIRQRQNPAGYARRACLWLARSMPLFCRQGHLKSRFTRPPLEGPTRGRRQREELSARNAGCRHHHRRGGRARTAGERRPRALARRSRAMRFRSWWSARIWEIVAWAGVFPHRLFPTLEEVALSFVQLTVAGILPHHAIETVIRLLSGFALAAVFGVDHRRADGTLAPGRGHLPAAGEHLRADPRPRLCAAVPALVRARQFFRRAAGRLRLGVSDHLQQLDRREGGEGNLGALGAIHGRRRPPAVQPRDPAGRAALHPHRPAARPGAGLAHPGRGRDARRRALGPRLADLRRARIPQHRRHAGRHRR